MKYDTTGMAHSDRSEMTRAAIAMSFVLLSSLDEEEVGSAIVDVSVISSELEVEPAQGENAGCV